MSEETIEDWEGRPMKMFGIFLPKLPSLTIRLGATFLRFKKNAQRAEKAFKKELLNQGLDKETASELTKKYMEGSKLSNFIQTMR